MSEHGIFIGFRRRSWRSATEVGILEFAIASGGDAANVSLSQACARVCTEGADVVSHVLRPPVGHVSEHPSVISPNTCRPSLRTGSAGPAGLILHRTALDLEQALEAGGRHRRLHLLLDIAFANEWIDAALRQAFVGLPHRLH